jgi:large conductance mechanosensitive channel
MAVGVIIGAAFGKIVTSLVTDVVMPPIGRLLGSVDFSNLFIDLSGSHLYTSLAEAQKSGVPTLNYGLFINNVINFLIVSFVVFILIKQVNRLDSLHAKPTPSAPTTKECRFCLMSIPIKATKCGHCTSSLS